MKKILVVLALFVAMPSIAALIDYDRVTGYTDNTSIPAAKIPTIQYRGYYGPAPTGPWTPTVTVTDNLTISAPDPPAGGTWWYTVDATLDGVTSAKAAAMSKTVPFKATDAPLLRGVR